MANLSNHYLEHINWLGAEVCNFVINNSVDVWRINISANTPLLDDFLAVMNPAEIARANKYFHTKDKNRFIVARGALRYILGRYLNQAPSSIAFSIGVNKKPYLEQFGEINLHYNISHSGDWILLAISAAEVGADTEFINESFEYQDIIKEYFSADEISFINQEQSVERFFTLWTRKEAFAKATGSGLDDNIKTIPCLDGDHEVPGHLINSTGGWLINSFKLYENYVATVASLQSTNSINFWDINFKTNVF